jgi:hypothetical protein
VTRRLPQLTMMLISALFVGPLSGLAQSPTLPGTNQNGIASEGQPPEADANPPEMRASIVDRHGDEFIAKTEDGEEFRLPVEGAPKDVEVGDELRLVPDANTETIYVFKAEPSDGGTSGTGRKPDSQL